MTVTIDQYGYMVCSKHPDDKIGLCDDIRTFMFSPESSDAVRKSVILQVPLQPLLFAQVRFKQWHSVKNHWVNGHEGAGAVQIHLEWKPEGSSRHHDAYLGTYLPTDSIRDVYMQIKFYLFDQYAPQGDAPTFTSDFACTSELHNDYAEEVWRGEMNESVKVANIFTKMTENKCLVCWRRFEANQVDLSAYVPDADKRLGLPRGAPPDGQPPADASSVARPQYSQGGVIPRSHVVHTTASNGAGITQHTVDTPVSRLQRAVAERDLRVDGMRRSR